MAPVPKRFAESPFIEQDARRLRHYGSMIQLYFFRQQLADGHGCHQYGCYACPSRSWCAAISRNLPATCRNTSHLDVVSVSASSHLRHTGRSLHPGGAVESTVVIMGLPFSIVLLCMMYGLFKALHGPTATRACRARHAGAHAVEPESAPFAGDDLPLPRTRRAEMKTPRRSGAFSCSGSAQITSAQRSYSSALVTRTRTLSPGCSGCSLSI